MSISSIHLEGWSLEALKVCWVPTGTELSHSVGHPGVRRADPGQKQPSETVRGNLKSISKGQRETVRICGKKKKTE